MKEMLANINIKEYCVTIYHTYVKKKYRKIKGKTREFYFDIDEHVFKDMDAENIDGKFLGDFFKQKISPTRKSRLDGDELYSNYIYFFILPIINGAKHK